MLLISFFGLKNQLNRAKTLACLIGVIVSLFLTPSAYAEDVQRPTISRVTTTPKSTNFEIKVTDEAELKDLLLITRKIVFNKKLYTYLNEVFKNQLIVPPELQNEYHLPSQIKGLSEAQILYILKSIPNYKKVAALFEAYNKKIAEFQDSDPAREDFISHLKEEFKSVLSDEKFIDGLKALNDPSKALTVGYKSGKAAFESAEFHSNRGETPANLKQIILDHIHSAKESISINIFEFSLMDIAVEIGNAVRRGVNVKIGIDSDTTVLADENKAVLSYLQQLEKDNPQLMKVTLVDAVGLNHQKIVAVDSGTKDASVLFSSGNFTQSCIGPEGDAINIPENLRPKKSKPNSNHLVIYKNRLASLITEHELFKTIDLKIRGQKEYPISGQYIFKGNKIPSTGRNPIMGIAFSPNGGMGEVSSSVIRPHILNSGGQVLGWQFVTSAPSITDALIRLAQNDPMTFDYKSLTHPSFSMQGWNTNLQLSGLVRDPETKKYSAAPNFILKNVLTTDQFTRLQNNIRINTNEYGDFQYEISDHGFVKITVKVHDKIFIFPLSRTAILGTSYNPSMAAEGNQEQIFWLIDHPIVDQAEKDFYHEFRLANTTVVEQAKRRNKFINDLSGTIVPKDETTERILSRDNIRSMDRAGFTGDALLPAYNPIERTEPMTPPINRSIWNFYPYPNRADFDDPINEKELESRQLMKTDIKSRTNRCLHFY